MNIERTTRARTIIDKTFQREVGKTIIGARFKTELVQLIDRNIER